MLFGYGPHRAHRWDSRRCIEFTRYANERAAENAVYFARGRFARRGPQDKVATACPHCNGWHLLPERFWWGETGAAFLARLPPLFTPPPADTSRYYFNWGRR